MLNLSIITRGHIMVFSSNPAVFCMLRYIACSYNASTDILYGFLHILQHIAQLHEVSITK